VVRDDIYEDADSDFMKSREHFIEVGESSKLWIDIAVIVYVVTAISESRWVEGAEPDSVKTERS
jgi:hypothetical protein